MDPLTIAVAAGAYVAAELAKKSADALISETYRRLVSYVMSKVGPKAVPEQLDAANLRRSGLAEDPLLLQFGRDVLARSSALRRAQLVESVVKGARILWVDDQPENNKNECRLF